MGGANRVFVPQAEYVILAEKTKDDGQHCASSGHASEEQERGQSKKSQGGAAQKEFLFRNPLLFRLSQFRIGFDHGGQVRHDKIIQQSGRENAQQGAGRE